MEEQINSITMPTMSKKNIQSELPQKEQDYDSLVVTNKKNPLTSSNNSSRNGSRNGGRSRQGSPEQNLIYNPMATPSVLNIPGFYVNKTSPSTRL